MTLYGAARAPSSDSLTENGGAIGGTNDGDMPDVSSVSGTYTQAEVVAIRDAVREIAAKLNAVLAELKRPNA